MDDASDHRHAVLRQQVLIALEIKRDAVERVPASLIGGPAKSVAFLLTRVYKSSDDAPSYWFALLTEPP